MTAYYNEIDPYAAQWLRNLIRAGLIAPGDVDERSIADVRAIDLSGYTQCHFFAGIGIWSWALRRAGWPDDRPVWTGSCPCQPFSSAGKRGGFDDARHLWPTWFDLIRECRPVTVFGEQVASKDGLAWLDAVHADLEGASYAVGAVDTCAAGVGAPHTRQRLYWVADANDAGSQGRPAERQRAAECAAGAGGVDGGMEHAAGDGREQWRPESVRRGTDAGCGVGWVADSDGRNASAEREQRSGEQRQQPQDGIGVERLADASGERCEGVGLRLCERESRQAGAEARWCGEDRRPGPTNGHWRAADWLGCRDGKFRPVEPGTFPLVTGTPGRVGRLRAYGNGLCAETVIEFIAAAKYAIGG